MVAEIQTQQVANNNFFLDPTIKCAQAQEFDLQLSSLIIGQENAVRSMGNLYQLFLAGMNPSNRPLGALLFLGRLVPAKHGWSKPQRRFSLETLMP